MIQGFWYTPAGHGIVVAGGVGVAAALACLLWGAAEAVLWRRRKK